MKQFNFFSPISCLILILFLATSSIQLKLVVVQDPTEKHDQYVLWINSSAKFLSQEIEVVSTVLEGNQTFDQICMNAEASEIFLLSISTNSSVVDDVRRFSQLSNIPTIQVRNTISLYNPTNVSNVTMQNLSNYVQFIRPESIFYNIFQDLLLTSNITDCVVVYDEHSNITELLIKVFNASSIVEYRFIPMSTNDTVTGTEFGIFSNVILIGTMNNVQDFIAKAKDLMEEDSLNFYIVTKDIWPYLCDSCSVRRTLWIRPDIETSMIRYDKLNDYISNDLEHGEWIVMHEQIVMSFFYDLVNLTVVINEQLKSLANSSLNYTCSEMNKTYAVAFSLSDLISESGMVGKFGRYNVDEAGHFYQNVIGAISGIYEDKKSRLIKTVGNWSVLDGIQDYYGYLNVDITSLSTYSIVIAEAPPFIESKVDENGTIAFRGYCIDLIELLKDELGFNYSLYLVKDSLYGALNDRGEWNGLIRDLINGHADMAVADLSVTAERENYVDFTVPYYDLVGVTILMRKPEDDYSLFKFMTVLTPPVWFCIVGAYFFTSFIMWLFDKYSPSGPKQEAKFTFTQCLWYCMTALTPQGGPEAPNNISCKLVAATWWLFGFIIIASYTANLAAFLTVSRMESSISSLDDLSKQYKVKYAPIRGTSSEAYFKRMANIEQRFYDIWKTVSMNETMSPQERASLAVWDYPVSDKYTNMWRFMEANGLPSTPNEGYQKILDSKSSDEGFALIHDATSARYAVMTDCRFVMVGGEFNRKPYAIAVQQLSPLKDKLSGKILKLSSDRKLEELKDKWWKNNPNKKNCPEVETETSGISVKNIAGVFLVILGGIVFSVVTLVFEYFCLKGKDEKAKKLKHPKSKSNKVFTLKTINSTNPVETVFP